MKTLMLIRFDIAPRPAISNAIKPFFIENDKPWFSATPTTMITVMHTNAERIDVFNAIMATGQLGMMGFLLLEVTLETVSIALPAELGKSLLEYMGDTVSNQTTAADSTPTPRVRLDQLLDKVTATGIHSLTEAEQAELNELSTQLS